MILITGYDVYNGGRTRRRKYKQRLVNGRRELKAEKLRLKEFEDKRHKEPVSIYLHTREEIGISELDLSKETKRALTKSHIDLLSKVADMSLKEISELDYVGDDVIREIHQFAMFHKLLLKN